MSTARKTKGAERGKNPRNPVGVPSFFFQKKYKKVDEKEERYRLTEKRTAEIPRVYGRRNGGELGGEKANVFGGLIGEFVGL